MRLNLTVEAVTAALKSPGKEKEELELTRLCVMGKRKEPAEVSRFGNNEVHPKYCDIHQHTCIQVLEKHPGTGKA